MHPPSSRPLQQQQRQQLVLYGTRQEEGPNPLLTRRGLVARTTSVIATTAGATAAVLLPIIEPAAAATGETEFVQQYDDFTKTSEGWSYRDVTVKSGGERATKGDRVVFEWSGYTVGYFGRPFQAKGGPTGGAFDKDLDYSRTVIGSGTMVKGLECGLVGMRPGSVRQIVVPFDEEQNLSYPTNDPKHDRVGPKPTTFSGERALNFVLDNPRLDRTLLFNVKVIRVDKPNGSGGFLRG